MKNQIHILNGDMLKEQFPEDIKGTSIILRECLVDGPASGNTLNEMFATRAKFISQYYGVTAKGYFENSVSEILKILEIKDGFEINLWFEDDLFCQVNFWFVVYLLRRKVRDNPIYLVRPEVHNQYGFGGLDSLQLQSIYKNRIPLSGLDKVSALWEAYRFGHTDELIKTAEALQSLYPFILPVVKAHCQRFPANGVMGRPGQSLLEIIEELKTEKFEILFKEFSKRESIYGFGDLQVKRIYDQLKSKA